ncbi:MAG TPA: pitrilysin family protein [Bacteroidales bacterium]|mgnify:FL=1|nr:pitrilysin family protein [Bacteroidales bacterium]HOR81489.1 pitrilysin family protein [Bacteroidales bacterium]HPJ90664.1 pitrilysin family protein [Bacteroidales bacterium]
MYQESYNYHQLSNGIKIIHKQVQSAVTHIGIAVNTGTRDELENENGLAHFIEHIIFKGTKKRNTYQVLSYLENVGGDLNAYTTKEETFFYASVMNSYIDRAIEILTDIVFNSAFHEKDIAVEKDVVIEEIKSYKDNPSELIFDEFENLVFEGHTLGTNILGTIKSVKSFNKEKIEAFLKRTYHTDQMVVAVVGNVDFKKCVKLIQKHLGVVAENKRNYNRLVFNNFSTQQRIRKHNGLQSHVMIGQVLPHYNETKNKTAVLLNNILGGPGSSSLLNMAIREKNGYVYTIESSYASLSDVGLFSVYAASDPKIIDKSIQLIFKEMDKLQTHKLGILQLQRAKQQLIGQTYIAHESNMTEMLSIARTHLLYEEVDTIADIVKQIEDITASDLLELANEMFAKDKLSMLIFNK